MADFPSAENWHAYAGREHNNVIWIFYYFVLNRHAKSEL